MGWGDDIMITGYAKELNKKFPDHQIVAGNRKEKILVNSQIFQNNPILGNLEKLKNTKTIWIESFPGNRPYILKQHENYYQWNYKHKPNAGEIFFSKNETEYAKQTLNNIKLNWFKKNKNDFKKIIFIEPSRVKRTKNNGAINRDWGILKWQKLINNFKNEYLFIQPVYNGSEYLDGVFGFECGFRNACAVMRIVDFVISWEGGYVHAAAALNKKGIFLYGGWIDPKITGYDIHNNIYVDIENSPCGNLKKCNHCDKCRELITVNKISEIFLEKIYK